VTVLGADPVRTGGAWRDRIGVVLQRRLVGELTRSGRLRPRASFREKLALDLVDPLEVRGKKSPAERVEELELDSPVGKLELASLAFVEQSRLLFDLGPHRGDARCDSPGIALEGGPA